jgi:N-acetylglutamate synthase-like GNAT family acetyltransferase
VKVSGTLTLSDVSFMETQTWTECGFKVSTDPGLMNLDLIHGELGASYWAAGIPRSVVEKSIRHSLCFGVYEIASGRQCAFARVVSDFSTFAYIGDVFVVAVFRGRGISKLLMKCLMAHPELQGLRRMCLGTRDAHTLYKQFGFKMTEKPENWLEIQVADIYLNRVEIS